MGSRSNTGGNPKQTIRLQHYSAAELAKIYEVDTRTFKKWLKDIPGLGLPRGRYYMTSQVKIIFDFLSLPSSITIEPMVQNNDLDP